MQVGEVQILNGDPLPMQLSPREGSYIWPNSANHPKGHHVGGFQSPAISSSPKFHRTFGPRSKGATTMCDYSLMALPNRLAVCGDELVVHRFELGSLGLASAADVSRRKQERENASPDITFFDKLKKWFHPPVPAQCTVVCIPPGARLLLRDIPEKMQQVFCLSGPVQEVTFTQIGTVGFRDSVRFPNGTELLLQRLTEGQRVRVIALSAEEELSSASPNAVLSGAGL